MATKLEQSEYVTLIEAAAMLGRSDSFVNEKIKTGQLKAKKTGGRWRIERDILKEYMIENHNFSKFTFEKWDEVFKPITTFNNPSEIFDIYRHEPKDKYLISNYGRVYSFNKNDFLKADIKNTYYYINLPSIQVEKKDHNYIHVLVAYFFCDNEHYKTIVHHIDGNPKNNYYKNLLWVTDKQHKELHALMKEDKKSYRKKVSEIRKENKWK